MTIIEYLIISIISIAFGLLIWGAIKCILMTLKLNIDSDRYKRHPKFNYYVCSRCGHKSRLDGLPKSLRYCPECTGHTLCLVPPFRTTWRQLEEVTDLICETCEIPLRIGSSTIYCPYCDVHNPYELYVKGDESEPVVARKVVE